MAYTPEIESEWLSLQQASRLLGVHPATLRAWSDRGRIASRRTPGGHRRFRRTDLQAWMENQRRREPDAQLLVQSALGRVRLELEHSENHAAWLAQYSEPLRRRHREMGRQLLGLLMRFMSSPDERAHAMSQACDLARQYAEAARENGLTLAAAVQAVMFFRDSLTDSVVQMASSLGAGEVIDWPTAHRQVTTFINDVLLAMIESYTSRDKVCPE